MNTNVIYKLCIASALVLALSLCYSNTSVFATDAVETLENKTTTLESELAALNKELSDICLKLDGIIVEMQVTSDTIATTQNELVASQDAEKKQQENMGLRIQYIYENGGMSFLEMLVTAKSMGEFLNTAEFISDVSEYDRNMLIELVSLREEVLSKEAALMQEQSTLLTLKEDLSTQQTALSEKINSTSADLTEYSDKLAQAKAAEKAAQDQLIAASQKRADTLDTSSSGNNIGTETSPSTPAAVGDVALLAAIIECEAGGSSYDGMVAVGGVILNRVRSSKFPNTISDVIYQKGQFSPVRSGKLDKVLARGARSTCINAANDALSGINPAGSCLYFNAASTGHSGTLIGGNIFW